MRDSREFGELEHIAENLPKTFHGYRYEKMIGKGGFSRIFLCRHLESGTEMCAKVILENSVSENVSTESDFKMLKSLQHRNILYVYEEFVENNMRHVILEFCPHGSLQTLVSSGELGSHQLKIWYMKQIIEALEYCHSKGITHRDIKPANILIDAYMRPKLIDFGISMKIEQGELVREFSGSPPYSAPEVLLEQEHNPFLADVWSLGVTFYYMAVGKLPWPKDEKAMKTAIEQAAFLLPRNVHPDIGNLIRAMLRVEPKNRPTMKALLEFEMFANEGGRIHTGSSAAVSPLIRPSFVSSYYVVRHNSKRDGGIKTEGNGTSVTSLECLQCDYGLKASIEA